LLHAFRPAPEERALAARRPADDWSATGEVAVATRTTQLAAGELPAGTIAAQRTIISGRAGGDEVVRFTPTWYCTTELDPAWELMSTGWRVQVHGDAPFDARLEFPVAPADLGSHTPSYTANRPVNAVPYVCAAAPGMLSTVDLPPITPAGPAIAT
jgi:4-hydroxy-tetrahydrodipicolinate reductase